MTAQTIAKKRMIKMKSFGETLLVVLLGWLAELCG